MSSDTYGSSSVAKSDLEAKNIRPSATVDPFGDTWRWQSGQPRLRMILETSDQTDEKQKDTPMAGWEFMSARASTSIAKIFFLTQLRISGRQIKGTTLVHLSR